LSIVKLLKRVEDLKNLAMPITAKVDQKDIILKCIMSDSKEKIYDNFSQGSMLLET